MRYEGFDCMSLTRCLTMYRTPSYWFRWEVVDWTWPIWPAKGWDVAECSSRIVDSRNCDLSWAARVPSWSFHDFGRTCTNGDIKAPGSSLSGIPPRSAEACRVSCHQRKHKDIAGYGMYSTETPVPSILAVLRADRRLETNPNSQLKPRVMPAPEQMTKKNGPPNSLSALCKWYKNWRRSGSFSSSSSCCAQALFFSTTPAYP